MGKSNYKYKKLHPFKWFILQNYPFLEDSIDVLTNYELFCKLGEMINNQVAPINEMGEQVETLTNAFNDLYDWFENLDVQDEINNKLDDMAESGELEEIMAHYLQTKAVFGFNNVAEMKNATNLINGSFAQTYGYYSANDGGKALYKVRTITNDDIVNERTIIALSDNNLIAELISNEINPVQIGAYGDGIHDDTTSLQFAIDNFSNIKILNKSKFLISDTLTINKGNNGYINIIGESKGNTGLPNINQNRTSSIIATANMNKPIIELNNSRNCRFENIVLDGGAIWEDYEITTTGNATICLKMTDSPYNTFINVLFRGCTGNGVEVYGRCFSNEFENCGFGANGSYGYDSHLCTEHVTNWFHNCRFDGNITGNAWITGRFLSFENCAFENSPGYGLNIGYTDIETQQLSFYSCDIEGNYNYAMHFNTVINGIQYIGGQIIGKSDSNTDLLFIQTPLKYANFETHMSPTNSNKVIYVPYNTYLHGNFPKEFMDCLQVANCPTFWSSLEDPIRDTYYNTTLGIERLHGNVATGNRYGMRLNKYTTCEVETLGHTFSKISFDVSNISAPADINHTIYAKFQRGWNGQTGGTEAVISTTPDANGHVELTSSAGMWGQLTKLFIYISDDVELQCTNMSALER